jgi:hypothetical protein
MRLLRYTPSDSSTYVKYASGVFGRKPCIHIRLHLLATNPYKKYGLKANLRKNGTGRIWTVGRVQVTGLQVLSQSSRLEILRSQLGSGKHETRNL